MKINTTVQHNIIANHLRQNAATLTEPEQQVLSHLKDSFLMNAETSALTYGPDGRTDFQYQETISSSLVEALSPEVINALADAGITFETSAGMKGHRINATFPVVKS